VRLSPKRVSDFSFGKFSVWQGAQIMTIAYHQFESAPLIERLMREWRTAASEGESGAGASALSGVPDPDAGRKMARSCTIFDMVVERLAEAMTISLRALISHRLTIEVLDVRPVVTRQYLAQAPVPALLAPIALGQVVPRGILLISAPLGCAMVDHLFGTRGRAQEGEIFNRAFNATEQALMARFAEAMLQDLSTALAPVVDMPCRMETQQADAAERALQLRLSLQLNGQGGTVDILLPYGALEAFPDVPRGHDAPAATSPAPAPAPAPTPAPSPAWSGELAKRLQHLPLRAELSIEGARLPLAQVAAARVGTCLWLGESAAVPLTLSVGAIALVHMQLVGSKKGLALKPLAIAAEV